MPINTIANDDIRERLSHYTLADVITKDVLTVYEGWSIKRLAGFFVKHNISGAPVIAADDELVGVVTQSDITRFESREPSEREIKKLVEQFCGPFGGALDPEEIHRIQGKANDYCTINSIMTADVVSIDIKASVDEACSIIVDKGIHRLFVTENGLLVGVLSGMDILRLLTSPE